MSTAEAPTPIASRQLPLFDGHRVHRARLSFGGALELTLTNPEDVALVKAIELGKEGTVTLAIDGHEREIVLGCRCVGRSHKFRKLDEADSVVGVHRIVINDVRDGDDQDDD